MIKPRSWLPLQRVFESEDFSYGKCNQKLHTHSRKPKTKLIDRIKKTDKNCEIQSHILCIKTKNWIVC